MAEKEPKTLTERSWMDLSDKERINLCKKHGFVVHPVANDTMTFDHKRNMVFVKSDSGDGRVSYTPITRDLKAAGVSFYDMMNISNPDKTLRLPKHLTAQTYVGKNSVGEEVLHNKFVGKAFENWIQSVAEKIHPELKKVPKPEVVLDGSRVFFKFDENDSLFINATKNLQQRKVSGKDFKEYVDSHPESVNMKEMFKMSFDEWYDRLAYRIGNWNLNRGVYSSVNEIPIETRRAAQEAYGLLKDTVKDERRSVDTNANESRDKAASEDPRLKDDILKLAEWRKTIGSDIIEADKSRKEPLYGKVLEVYGVHDGAKLVDAEGKERRTNSKLILKVEVDGQPYLVNIRGAFHRKIGNLTDYRVETLGISLPEGEIDLTSDEALGKWFHDAGLRQSDYRRNNYAENRYDSMAANFQQMAEEKGLISEGRPVDSTLENQ